MKAMMICLYMRLQFEQRDFHAVEKVYLLRLMSQNTLLQCMYYSCKLYFKQSSMYLML